MLWKQLQTTYINEPCNKQLGSWDVKQYLKEKMREKVSYRDAYTSTNQDKELLHTTDWMKEMQSRK